MQHITKTSSVQHKNGTNCTVQEYEFKDEKDINAAIIEISGRYPDSGYVYNEICKEEVYVIDGSGKVTTPETSIQVTKGDMILIHPNDRYYYDGQLTIMAVCTPAWYPEQHKNAPVA
jgi:mannose-6-phosphate isomerase-like protein (cupin superfamily)